MEESVVDEYNAIGKKLVFVGNLFLKCVTSIWFAVFKRLVYISMTGYFW